MVGPIRPPGNTALLKLLFAAASLFTPLTPAVPLTTGDGLPAKAPSAVGMSAARLANIDRVIERGIRAGGYPGAAVVVGRKGAAVWEKGFGRLGWTGDAGSVVPERTIYDLASLTKVVATTTAIMILYDEGKIRLDDRVIQYIPEFGGGAKDNVTIRMLLEHRSGLPAGRDLWRLASTPEEARAAVISTPLFAAPGHYIEYSDLGAAMLGFVAEAISGERLDQFLETRVFGSARHDGHAVPSRCVASRTDRADGAQPAARLSAPRRGARRERLRTRRRGRPRGAVQHRERSRRLRADAPERGQLQRYAHRRRLHREALHPPRRGHPRARLGHVRRQGQLREVSQLDRLRTHRLHRHLALDRSRARDVRRAADEPRARRTRASSGEGDQRRPRRSGRRRRPRGDRLEPGDPEHAPVVPRRSRGGLEPSRVHALAFGAEPARQVGARSRAARAAAKARASKSRASASKSTSARSPRRRSPGPARRSRRRRRRKP